MVDAEQVEHRGVHVVHGADLVDGGVAKVISRPVDQSTLDAAAGHPDRHRLVVMVAAGALRHRRAAKLTGPDQQCLVQHAPVLQVGDQCHAGPVDLLGLVLHTLLDATVVVPVFVIHLDEPHTPLRQPPGQQAVGGKRPVPRLAAVEGKCFG